MCMCVRERVFLTQIDEIIQMSKSKLVGNIVNLQENDMQTCKCQVK